jgi:signal transduction histidine kinase
MANEEISAISRTLEEKVTERTQELRDFVSIAAHDLRNPLTVIRGITELLLEGRAEGADPRRNRQIGLLAANVDHMLDLTDNLLDLSRLHEGSVRFDVEALPIQIIIEEVCEGFEGRLAAKGLGLKVDLAPDLVPVWGDRLRLTQVLNNLVANAYHYTPAGAVIVNARHVDSLVEVSVSDTGIGISTRDQKRLFARFFRGEHEVVHSTKGTGLGLAISWAIVEGHGGEMSVESELGRGSTFRFTVPVAPDSPPGDGVMSTGQVPLSS